VDKLKGFFEKLDAGQLVKALGAYIAHRWTDATWYGRGEFVGQVIGYIALNVLLIMATAGGSIGVLLARSAAAGSDVARAVMVLVKVVDVAQNPLKLLQGAGKGLAVGEEVAAKLKQGLPREAKLAAKAEQGAEGAAKFAEDAEAARNINHPGDTPMGGRKGTKPAMTAEAHSLDGLANFSYGVRPRSVADCAWPGSQVGEAGLGPHQRDRQGRPRPDLEVVWSRGRRGAIAVRQVAVGARCRCRTSSTVIEA
jgi:uncharacterized membrane protein